MLTAVPPHDDQRTYAIIGAALEVHRVQGSGFLELFYKDALALEFTARGIPFEAEVPLALRENPDVLKLFLRLLRPW